MKEKDIDQYFTPDDLLLPSAENLRYEPGDDILGIYFQEIGKCPLLGAEEEVALAKLMENGRFAGEELALNEASAARRWELASIIHEGEKAKDFLILANTRLVIKVAKKYRGNGSEFLDLIQAGNKGLMVAVDKYDYHRGYRFSTYAKPWIRQAIGREIDNRGREIRLPVATGQEIYKLARIRSKLRQELGKEPTIEEVAKGTGFKTKKIDFLDQIEQRPISLETLIDNKTGNTLTSITPDKKAVSDRSNGSESLVDRVKATLANLPFKEEQALRMYYCFDGNSGKKPTYKTIGAKLGCSGELVRRHAVRGKEHFRDMWNFDDYSL